MRCAAFRAALVVMAAASARAQATGATRAAVFLTLPSSARALALGEAWGAVADDESALFYNPAQLARVRGVEVGGSVQRYVASTTLGAFAVNVPLAAGTGALGLQVLDYGSEEEFVPADGTGGQQGVPTGRRVSAQDLAVSAGYGASFGPERRLRLGGAVKFVNQHVANVSGGDVAADVGVAYTAGRGWEVSGAVQHFGPHLTLAAVSAPLPLTWRAALAAPMMRAERVAFRTMAEVRQTSGADATAALAAEVTWRADREIALAGRAGYAFRGASDARSPLTLGGGVSLGSFSVQYAYEGFDLLGGATHRVGVHFAAPPRGH